MVNAHVAAREWKDDIVFLRKIVAGRSDRSYGVQVARLAGLPPSVVARARDILIGLERDELSRGGRPTLSGAAGDTYSAQLGLFAATDNRTVETPGQPGTADADSRGADFSASGQEILRRLRILSVDDTTPRQAWDMLAELKALADE